MKKKILLRALLGLPLGIAIGYMITILTSVIWGRGYYSPCVPILIEYVGSEIGAVILQTLLCACLGAAFAGISVIWEMESWSIMKQTGIYFFAASLIMFPIAYITGWMERSLVGFGIYFIVFVIIFIVIWLIQYCIWRQRITKINNQIHKS